MFCFRPSSNSETIKQGRVQQLIQQMSPAASMAHSNEGHNLENMQVSMPFQDFHGSHQPIIKGKVITNL